MRVVVLTQWFPPEKAALPADIAQALSEAGHEVVVLTGFPNYPTGRLYDGWTMRARQDERQGDVLVRRVALYPSHDRSVARRAANYLSFAVTSTLFGWRLLRRADVVYVYHPPLTAAIGPWLSRFSGGSPYVLHVQDLWPDSVVDAGMLDAGAARTAGRLLGRACRTIYQGSAKILVIAPTMAALLEGRGVPARKLHVVPNWADESTFSPVARSDATRQRLGLGTGFVVMFAGNMGELQGLDVAVRAAARLRDLPGFQLALVGDGIALSKLKSLAAELRAENVVFVPAQPITTMSEVTAASDVQLVSLRDKPFLRGTIPSKLGSILATGVAVICAAAGDAANIVEAAGAGWTCPPEDDVALAMVFRVAAGTSVASLQTLGTAGYDYYRRTLSRQAGVTAIVHVMEDVARLPGRQERQ